MNEKWLSIKLRANFTRIRLWTFESCGLPNVPDLFAAYWPGVSFWIELKCVDSDRCLIPFRKGQPGWIDGYTEMNGVVFLLVLDKGSKNLFLLKLTIPGDARVIASKKLREAFNGFGLANWRLSLPDWPQSIESRMIVATGGKSPDR